MRLSTTLAELQNTILQKLGVTRSKCISNLFYRAPVAVVSEHAKYGSFVVQTDADLEVIFHYRRDFPEVRMTELFAKLEDIVASSGGSNPIPPSVDIGGSSSSAPVAPVVPVIPPPVASPSFAADLHHDYDDQCDLEDNRTFEALCEDEEEDEPELVPEDSDDDDRSIPVPRREPASSGSHQYPEHFSSLDIDAIAPTHEDNDAGTVFGGGGSVDVLTPNEFEIGQIFQTKEDAVLCVKSYSIRRGVEYKVKESDHAKYHARCKNFGSGCEWLIRVALRTRKGFWEVRRRQRLGVVTSSRQHHIRTWQQNSTNAKPMPRHCSALPTHAQHLGTRTTSHQRVGIKPMPRHWLNTNSYTSSQCLGVGSASRQHNNVTVQASSYHTSTPRRASQCLGIYGICTTPRRGPSSLGVALFSDPMAHSVNPRGNDTLLTFYYLIRSGALAGGALKFRKDFGHQGNRKNKQLVEFDPEIEKTLTKNRNRVKAQKVLQGKPSEET
ncbi:hypothetical protein PIB30_068620 [Stylosanthes scabra]|uniref:Transposase MuDR plant domain-containing protein n=1 Tax=Stylosanthes scabra TaxID=79078 RepID=A0ABU6QP33_9FABA|nr:hypothetical protein [Stylosanthes scabra]